MVSSESKIIMKSEKCAKVCYVRFVNSSERTVELIWINYKGTQELYKVMLPKEVYDVTTFETHPWIFRDHFTYNPLRVSSSNVYYPKQRSIPLVPPCLVQGELVTTRPARVLVAIRISVYSLTDLCMYAVRRNLRSKDDVPELEIPHTLKEELSVLWRNT